MDTWANYYQATAGRAPRQLFQRVLTQCAAATSPGFAIDLGCGDGTETLVLLEAGWQVLAIDNSADALALVQAKAQALPVLALETRQMPFEALHLPAADLIYAGFSLPFCHPAHFAAAWSQIRAALRPGARFAGHLFGERDTWAGDKSMSFCTLSAAYTLLDGLEIEYLHEIDEYGLSFVGPKHWHIFELIARQPL